MARNEGKATPFDAGLVARVAAGASEAFGSFRNAFFGGGKGSEWFGPQQPPTPALDPQSAVDAGVAGRQLDYVTGINVQTQPRAGEPISFPQLRALADNYDLLRLVIETRKDQVCALPWAIVPRDKKLKPDARCEAAEALMRCPDGENDWPTWLRMLLEDLFVLDAPAVYVRRTLGGDVLGFEPIDGATIKRVVDKTGRTPADGPAYQQVLKGVLAVDYSKDELIYRPRNRRTHKIYGYGPVEQVINIVNIALRRQQTTLDYFTDGTIPDAVAGVPEEWNTEQIKLFQDYWDLLMQSDFDSSGQRRKLKFVPGKIAQNFVLTKQPPLKDMFDEWLARIVCYCMSIDATPFVAQVNRSVAETTREQSMSEGLGPLKIWVEALVSRCLSLAGYDDLVLTWPEGDISDQLKRQQILCGYVTAKVMADDEAREKIGLPPLTLEQRDQLKPPPPPMLAVPAAPPGGSNPKDPKALPGKPGGAPTDEPPSATKRAASVTHETLIDAPVTVHVHLTDGTTQTQRVENSAATGD